MTVANIENIKARKDFYRNLYRKTLTLSVGLLILLLVMLVINVYIYFTRPAPRYYATSSNGSVIAIKPL
jgi:lipopolysaccharide/colanic/teichoic acid biosynthesis glycosyltransferase